LEHHSTDFEQQVLDSVQVKLRYRPKTMMALFDMAQFMFVHSQQVITDTKKRLGNMEDGELADLALFCRKFADHCQHMKKTAANLQYVAQIIAADRVIKRCVAADKVDAEIVGEYAKGFVRESIQSKVPERGTKEYDELFEFLGLSKEAADDGLVRPHWPSVNEFLETKVANGEDVPDYIMKQSTVVGVMQVRERNDHGQESE
jgi:hypothetical protein